MAFNDFFESGRNPKLASAGKTDVNGNPVDLPVVMIQGGTVTLDVSSVEIGEVVLKDGTSTNVATIDSSGRLSVFLAGGTPDSLPLPSGAATETSLAALISAVGNTTTAVLAQAKLTDTQPVSIASTVTISGSVIVTSGSMTISSGNIAISNTPAVTLASTTISSGNITVNNGSGAAAVPIQDGGNSITVDGTFWQTTQPVSDVNLELAQGSSATSAVGPMVQGAVAINPVTIAAGLIAPITLTPDSRLRVSVDEDTEVWNRADAWVAKDRRSAWSQLTGGWNV